MKFTDLGNPRLRRHELAHVEYTYPIIGRKDLSRNVLQPRRNFFDVVNGRRTYRSFGKVKAQQLSSFLWWTSYTREVNRLPSGFVWEHRPVPSAGGRHPVDLLVLQKARDGWHAHLYEPMTHRLLLLAVDRVALQKLINEIAALVQPMHATILWLVAQPSRIAAKYVNGDSLVWRDAGVLLGHMALVAEALGLSFCPLGITGEPFVKRVFGPKGEVVGVGGCLLGMRRGLRDV